MEAARGWIHAPERREVEHVSGTGVSAEYAEPQSHHEQSCEDEDNAALEHFTRVYRKTLNESVRIHQCFTPRYSVCELEHLKLLWERLSNAPNAHCHCML